MRSCLAEALRSVRLPDSPAGLEAVRALERDLEGYLRVESALDMPLAPRDFEVRFGDVRLGPGPEGGPEAGRLRRVRDDRPHRPRPGDVRARRDLGLQERPRGALGRRHRERLAAADPALHPGVRELVGVEPSGASTGRWRESVRPRHGVCRRGRDAATGTTSWTKRCSGAGWSRPSSDANRDRPADAGGRCSPRSAPGHAARTGAGGATPGSAGCRVVSEPAWNEGQRQAIERRGHVFVSAGAGTGKTAVLVERVCGGSGRDAARPPAGDHVHRAGGGRAEGPRPRAAARGRTTRRARRRSTRPGSRRSTASAAGCCEPTRWTPASTRPSACRPRRRR